jgi:hypothetical protein
MRDLNEQKHRVHPERTESPHQNQNERPRSSRAAEIFRFVQSEMRFPLGEPLAQSLPQSHSFFESPRAPGKPLFFTFQGTCQPSKPAVFGLCLPVFSFVAGYIFRVNARE